MSPFARSLGLTSLVAGLCILSAVFISPSARATTMIAMSIEELVDEADLVVMGKAVASDTFFSGTKVLTQVRVQVMETWKGTAPCHVDVLTFGGEVGSISQMVGGVARLPLHQPMVLFLRGAASQTGEFHVLGLGQGAWHVQDPKKEVGDDTLLSQSDVDALVGGRKHDGRDKLSVGQLRQAVKGRADARL